MRKRLLWPGCSPTVFHLRLWERCGKLAPHTRRTPKVAALPDPYWLARCERWHVFAPKGRIGSVRRVLYGSRLKTPDALLLERGLLRKQTWIASTDEVEQVDPVRRRLVLRRAPTRGVGFPDVLQQRIRATADGAAAEDVTDEHRAAR